MPALESEQYLVATSSFFAITVVALRNEQTCDKDYQTALPGFQWQTEPERPSSARLPEIVNRPWPLPALTCRANTG